LYRSPHLDLCTLNNNRLMSPRSDCLQSCGAKAHVSVLHFNISQSPISLDHRTTTMILRIDNHLITRFGETVPRLIQLPLTLVIRDICP
jgi:hypothetical protein